MTQVRSVAAVLQAGVDEGVFPGAVLHVRRAGRVVFEQAVGRITYAVDAPMVSPATVYDLASLTKPLATTTAVLDAIERGRLELAQPVGDVLSELRSTPVGAASIEHLLAHASGLPAWRPYYERLAREPGSVDLRLDRTCAARCVLEWIGAEPLERPIGTGSVYSDLGFILLGFVIERLNGSPLSHWYRGFLQRDLPACGLDFIDGSAVARSVFGPNVTVAPTEQDSWRSRLLCGEVHDENAWALGGTAGHAGLFGTAESVGRMAQWWLHGVTDEPVHGRSSLRRRFVSRVTAVRGTSRALGWDTLRAVVGGAVLFAGVIRTPGIYGDVAVDRSELRGDRRVGVEPRPSHQGERQNQRLSAAFT